MGGRPGDIFKIVQNGNIFLKFLFLKNIKKKKPRLQLGSRSGSPWPSASSSSPASSTAAPSRGWTPSLIGERGWRRRGSRTRTPPSPCAPLTFSFLPSSFTTTTRPGRASQAATSSILVCYRNLLLVLALRFCFTMVISMERCVRFAPKLVSFTG